MSYNENGDLVTEAGQVFRQIGWQINGGVNDKKFIELGDYYLEEMIKSNQPHGGYSPVYVEVGTE